MHMASLGWQFCPSRPCRGEFGWRPTTGNILGQGNQFNVHQGLPVDFPQLGPVSLETDFYPKKHGGPSWYLSGQALSPSLSSYCSHAGPTLPLWVPPSPPQHPASTCSCYPEALDCWQPAEPAQGKESNFFVS